MSTRHAQCTRKQNEQSMGVEQTLFIPHLFVSPLAVHITTLNTKFQWIVTGIYCTKMNNKKEEQMTNNDGTISTGSI